MLDKPDTDTTARAIHALCVTKPHGYQSAVVRARDWLIKEQHADGYWYTSGSPGPVYETVLVLDAIEFAGERRHLTCYGPMAGEPSHDPKDEAAGSMVSTTEERPWEAAATGGMPLHGWEDICTALGTPNKRNTQRKLRSLNKRTDGPIRWVGNRPEVDQGQLLSWIENAEERARIAAEARKSTEGAVKELGERGGKRQKDYGMHSEKRPNAKGKARPARDEGSR